MSVPDRLARLDPEQLQDLRRAAEADVEASPAAKARLGEHIDREQQRRTGR